MIFGTFDIIHAGHMHLFKTARAAGDELIVVVARDKNVKKIKGRPSFHTERQRQNTLRHINLIDKAVLGDKQNVCAAVYKYKPDVIVLGYDQKNFVAYLKQELTRYPFPTKIIRAKAYKPKSYKTQKIKQRLERLV